MSAYLEAMRRTFDFTGRSTRSDYWFFCLVFFLASFGLTLIVSLALQEPAGEATGSSVVASIFILCHSITFLSLTVRRLHDIDQSGWWVLIGLVPLIGQIAQAVFACTASTPGTNKFGPHPGDRPSSAAQPSYASPNRTGSSAAEAHDVAPGPLAAPAQPQQRQAATLAPIEQLERLAALRSAGAIDEAEFKEMKSGILGAAGRPSR